MEMDVLDVHRDLDADKCRLRMKDKYNYDHVGGPNVDNCLDRCVHMMMHTG
jgi:hypothetical protein